MANLEKLCILLRECLRRRFPLYEERHEVLGFSLQKDGKRLWVGYHTEGMSPNKLRDSTYFDLNFEEDICFLLDIQLKRKERGNGHGRDLYRTIEEFALLAGQTFVQMTPSGWALTGKTRREYVLDLGYEPYGNIEVRKRLK